MPHNRCRIEQRIQKRKFNRDYAIRLISEEYTAFLTDKIDRSYAKIVPQDQLDGKIPVRYLPNHVVYHSIKKTLSAVFDCGAGFIETSLNSQLL